MDRMGAETENPPLVIEKYNETAKLGKYTLPELNQQKNITKIEVFNKKDVNKLIEIYTKKELEFKDSDLKNIVFDNIESLENIQKSYSNYFLDAQRLLELLSKITIGDF